MICSIIRFNTNKFFGFLFVFICFFNSEISAVETKPQKITLDQSFRLARDRSTSGAIANDLVQQANSQSQEARAGFLPVLSLQTTTFQQAESSNPAARGLSSSSQSTTSLNLTQNLFQGFRDRSRVAERQQSIIESQWAEQQTLQKLFSDVAQAFYSILIFQSDILLYKEQIQSTSERRLELAAAKKSGRARDSDLLISDSTIANLEAAILRSESQLAPFEETFAFLTGLNVRNQSIQLVGTLRLPKTYSPADALTKRIDQRPDVQKSKYDVLAAEEAIGVARSGFYPSLVLTANYYFSRPTGLVQDSQWDAGLVLNFPFFSGGLTQGLVSEAIIIHHSKELNLRLAKELALQSIKTLASIVQTELIQLEKLTTASQLSRRSYELVRRDNRLGVATNMDVLTALQLWQETQRNLERLRMNATYDYLRLLVESGEIEINTN